MEAATTSLAFEALMSVLAMRWVISTVEMEVVVVGERWGNEEESRGDDCVCRMSAAGCPGPPAEEDYSHLQRGTTHL